MCMAVCTCRHPTLQVTFAWLSLSLSRELSVVCVCVWMCVDVYLSLVGVVRGNHSTPPYAIFLPLAPFPSHSIAHHTDHSISINISHQPSSAISTKHAGTSHALPHLRLPILGPLTNYQLKLVMPVLYHSTDTVTLLGGGR